MVSQSQRVESLIDLNLRQVSVTEVQERFETNNEEYNFGDLNNFNGHSQEPKSFDNLVIKLEHLLRPKSRTRDCLPRQ